MLTFLIFITPVLVIVAFVVFDTIRKRGEFGLRLSEPTCPKCGFRVPVEVTELWRRDRRRNRWECSVCGFLTDQWGKKLEPAPAVRPVELKNCTDRVDFDNPIDAEGRTPVERILIDDR